MKKILFLLTALIALSSATTAQVTEVNKLQILELPIAGVNDTILAFDSQGNVVNTKKTVTDLAVEKTSDILNDGEDGLNPFINANDVPTSLSEFTDDIGATDPIEARTYFVNQISGNDITGKFENYNQPYQSIDGVFSNFTADSSEFIRIVLIGNGVYNWNNPIYNINFEIYSDYTVTLDISGMGATQSRNVYINRNVAPSYSTSINLPQGTLKNDSNFSVQFNSEDHRIDLTLDALFVRNGATFFAVNRGVYFNKVNNVDVNNNLVGAFQAIKTPINLTSLNISGGVNIFGYSVNVTVGTINNTSPSAPWGTDVTWNIGNVNGDLILDGTRNQTINFNFNNSTVTGVISFRQNAGNLTFSGTMKKGAFRNPTASFDGIQTQNGRIPQIKFINFNAQELKGSVYFYQIDQGQVEIDFLNCFINKTDDLPLIRVAQNAPFIANIQKTTILQSTPSFIFESLIADEGNHIVNIGGVETNASSIANTSKVSVIFDVLSFKDKLGEIVVRNKVDIANKTLDPSITYIIDGTIELSAGEYIEVPASGNLTINGYGLEASRIIKNVAGESIFKSPSGGSGGLQMSGISFTTTGSVFDLSDSTGFNAIELNVVNFDGCNSLGEINGYRQFLGTTIGIYGCNDGFTLSGSWSGFKITNTNAFGFGDSGTLFKEGTSLLFSNRFYAELNISLPVGALLSDFQESNFNDSNLFQINNSVFKLNNTISRSNTSLLIPNISPSSFVSRWVNNIGISNTPIGSESTGGAQYIDSQYISGSALIVPTGSPTALLNNSAIVIDGNIPSDFTNGMWLNNKLVGVNDKDRFVTEVRFKAKTTVNNDYFDISINIGGSVGDIRTESFKFTRNSNTEQSFARTFHYFTGSTFIQNGGEIIIKNNSGELNIYDIEIVPTRVHRGY